MNPSDIRCGPTSATARLCRTGSILLLLLPSTSKACQSIKKHQSRSAELAAEGCNLEVTDFHFPCTYVHGLQSGDLAREVPDS